MALPMNLISNCLPLELWKNKFVLIHPVCGTLLWQPQETNREILSPSTFKVHTHTLKPRETWMTYPVSQGWILIELGQFNHSLTHSFIHSFNKHSLISFWLRGSPRARLWKRLENTKIDTGLLHGTFILIELIHNKPLFTNQLFNYL